MTSSVDFDFGVFRVCPNLQIAITVAYDVHFWKTIYGQNRHNEPYAKALVSSDSENLDF
jgi:hypothetical protein